MLKYVIRRLIQTIPLLIAISFAAFMIMHLVPGDPVRNMMGKDATKEAVEAERERLGLNDPLYVQYGRFIKGVVQGDLGTSIFTKESVTEEIKDRFPVTVKLALGATIFASVLGVLVGIISAVKRNKMTDNILMVLSLLAVSTPSFFLAMIMLLLFSLRLGWLPSMGLKTPLHYVLPIITLGMQSVGTIARTTRSSMLDVLGQDYMRTAKAKGLAGGKILFKHALRNAILPVITYVGPLLAYTVTGSFVVEKIFTIPGLGGEFITAINGRDYTLIMGTTIFLATLIILMNVVVDIVYKLVDPRIKLK